jgi:hypothetical protein
MIVLFYLIVLVQFYNTFLPFQYKSNFFLS